MMMTIHSSGDHHEGVVVMMYLLVGVFGLEEQEKGGRGGNDD